MNLAEQHLMACGDAAGTTGAPCSGGWPTRATKWIGKYGILDEESFPYKASNTPKCADSSKTPKDHIFFAGSEDLLPKMKSWDSLRSCIIHYGPLSVAVQSMMHAMTLIGYYSATGTPVLVFKNSHGPTSGDNGYLYKGGLSLSTLTVARYLLPVKCKTFTDDSVRCMDMDGDSYYWWGLGTKAKTCPEGIKDEEDCDDSNNKLGPMAADGSCKPISTGIVMNKLPNSAFNYNCTFNPITRLITINVEIPKNAKTTVQIYNVSGMLIKNLAVSDMQNGLQRAVWNGTSESGAYISNGIYLCRIGVENNNTKSSSSFKIAASR
jgi:hypothetical protein